MCMKRNVESSDQTDSGPFSVGVKKRKNEPGLGFPNMYKATFAP